MCTERVLTLDRFAYTEYGTFGRLFEHRVEGLSPLNMWTVEREWLDNRPFESCIPEGVYFVTPRSSRRFGEVMEVEQVPGRTDILFHAANWPDELQGCIAPGLSLGLLHREGRTLVGVRRSRSAMRSLTLQTGRSFRLFITSKPRTVRELGLTSPALVPWLPALTCGHAQAAMSPKGWTP